MSQVVEIRDLAQWAAWRLRWRALLGQTSAASFDHTPESFEARVGNGHGPLQPRVLAVLGREGAMIGMLPLIEHRARGVWSVERTLASNCGPVGPHPTATLFAALGHIVHGPHDWDAIELSDVTGQGSARIAAVAEALGCAIRPQRAATILAIQCGGLWRDYWRSRPQSARDAALEARRRLSRTAGWRYERIRPRGTTEGDGRGHWGQFTDCMHLGRRLGLLHSAAWNAQLRDLHERAARGGHFDLGMLWQGSRLTGFIYGHHFHGRVRIAAACVEPSPHQESVHALLWSRYVRGSFARADQAIEWDRNTASDADAWSMERFQARTHVMRREQGWLPALRHAAGSPLAGQPRGLFAGG